MEPVELWTSFLILAATLWTLRAILRGTLAVAAWAVELWIDCGDEAEEARLRQRRAELRHRDRYLRGE